MKKTKRIKKDRYWFLKIQVTIGEYENNVASIHVTENGEEFDAEKYAMDEYDGLDDEDTDGMYTFNGGEVGCCVYGIEEITKAEYDVMEKYI